MQAVPVSATDPAHENGFVSFGEQLSFSFQTELGTK